VFGRGLREVVLDLVVDLPIGGGTVRERAEPASQLAEETHVDLTPPL